MLPLTTGSAPVSGADLVRAFCLRHELQHETIIKAVWTHLMHVYFDCNYVIFRLIIFEHGGPSLVSHVVPGSQHEVQLGAGELIGSLKTIEKETRTSRAASQIAYYLQAEAHVDGDPLLFMICADVVIPQDILAAVIQVGICLFFRWFE
jgi:hypothetical protein